MIPRGSRLVVYGGDRLGVDVVHSILWNQDYKLVSWVDDQYETLGYPVRSPEELRGGDDDETFDCGLSGSEALDIGASGSADYDSEASGIEAYADRKGIMDTEYDFILIVSRSRNIFEKRRSELLDMGVNEAKIRWQNE